MHQTSPPNGRCLLELKLDVVCSSAHDHAICHHLQCRVCRIVHWQIMAVTRRLCAIRCVVQPHAKAATLWLFVNDVFVVYYCPGDP